MTVSDINTLVESYIREHLSPTDIEQAEISRRYNQLQDFLAGHTFQSGSYARRTSSTPVNDLDVIYQLPDEVIKTLRLAEAAIDPAKLDIKRIIESLAQELHDFYGTSATIKPQPHSVGIYFGSEDDFSIDVVPAVPADNSMFWVPETAHLSIHNRRQIYEQLIKSAQPPSLNWIKSDPKGYIQEATTVDDQSGGKLRKTVKLVKRWRWYCKQQDDRFLLKSFHAEIAVTGYFKTHPGSTCLEAARSFFVRLPELLERPHFPDRADESKFIDQYLEKLTLQEKVLILSKQQRAQDALTAVATADTPQTVADALRIFLRGESKTGIIQPFQRVLDKVTRSFQQVFVKGIRPVQAREANEQFLTDFGIITNLQYSVRINANVTQDGFRPFKLLGSRFPLKKYKSLEFIVEYCSVPEPYEIKWKVKNTGAEARRIGQLRGEIYDDDGYRRRKESTKYWGNHYVECYVIKNGVCVAADHIDVDIGKN
ncbi:hypothetical protein TRIP_C20073 [Candidatus Zixiibacteriota bacterium]|nr:hypothetical protein TRIP_C20073 [candidate division Zixibacteria bacterium]